LHRNIEEKRVLYSNQILQVYSGDKQTAVYPARDIQRWQQNIDLITDIPFSFLQSLLPLDSLFFAHQVHDIKGIHIDNVSTQQQRSFIQEADFIYTNRRNVGIGVLTADCVGLVLYDPVHGAIAVVHAGWRGAVHGVVYEALHALQRTYNTVHADLQVFFGPSARACCYEVDELFVKALSSCAYADEALSQKGSQLFFDIPTLIVKQLAMAGVMHRSINMDYALCTICSTQFCSHRREKEQAGRQMLVAVLR
jgi:purine-nucleoside/S-methyl-5'-thioadenosine phosphorylase / adenosine deaminase